MTLLVLLLLLALLLLALLLLVLTRVTYSLSARLRPSGRR